jgi:hypothetical protein
MVLIGHVQRGFQRASLDRRDMISISWLPMEASPLQAVESISLVQSV